MNTAGDKIWQYIKRRYAEGKFDYILQGGRRSGKTWHILQFLGMRCEAYPKHVVSVAAMTRDQGRLGAYSDMKRIIDLYPSVFPDADCKTSPLEIRFKGTDSVMIFKSYDDPETAKGIYCNDLYINEGNKFTRQQYIDLKANATDFTFIDFNPNEVFWVGDMFDPDEICLTTWKDNAEHLSPAQLEYFADLKARAESPNATSTDLYLYAVYYLGQYGKIEGPIFNEGNMRMAHELPRRADGSLALRNFRVFCDPSALRGADWFACCLSAIDDDGNVWIIDTFSVNTGTREAVARWIIDICGKWDVRRVHIETNGIVGLDFYDFAVNSGIRVDPWYSRGNKFERIVDNYQNLTTRLVVLDSDQNREYMKQVYTFAKKCEHDDNIDAINSSYNLQRWTA